MKTYKNTPGDIFGGITAGIVTIPLALGFGAISGLGAAAGLYTAIILCLVVSVFGGTRTQISGPTGPMTVFIAAIVAAYADNMAIVFAIMAMAGLFQIMFGFARAGALLKFIPKATIAGFISGIGVITIILQLPLLLGFTSPGGILPTIKYLTAFPEINVHGALLGLLAFIIVMFPPKRLLAILPFSLVALVAGTIAAVWLAWDVPTIGYIPTRLINMNLDFSLFGVETFMYIIPIALGLALLSSIDTLMTSKAVTQAIHTKNNYNKDLVGIGIANTVSSLFGGFAGSNSTVPTMANIKFGGRARLSALVAAAVLLSVLFFLAPVASLIPLAVLAGILVRVGIGIIDWKLLGKIITFRTRKRDAVAMLTVLAFTMFGELVTGVVIGSLLYRTLRYARYKMLVKAAPERPDSQY